jgi:hypothetical protein
LYLISIGIRSRPADPATPFPRSVHAGGDPLFDQLPLKLGHGADDVHHEAAGWRAEVKIVTQGDKGHAIGAEILDRRDQVLQAATKPVELPANDRIERSM